jgi:hypothetical protein
MTCLSSSLTTSVSLKKKKETYTCSIKRVVKFHVVSLEGVARDWLKRERERVGVETLKEDEPLGSYL